MNAEQIKAVADNLARNRATGTLSNLPLADIRNIAEAAAIQSAAMSAFATDVVGYTIVGTSVAVRRSIGLSGPIFGTIAQGTVLREDAPRFCIPNGFIGAQCELVLTIGPIPDDARQTDRNVIERSILGCQPGIGLLGRRTISPPSYLGAMADYSLHVATICGRYSEHSFACDLNSIVVRARIDGNDIAHAPASSVMDHPLNAVSWLASQLQTKSISLNAGDIVATGSCTPVLQVLPGQRLEVDFGPIGKISCDFE